MNFKQISGILPHSVKITDSENSLEYELNSLLAEEYQAWYQYLSVYPFLSGKERPSIQGHFNTFAIDELHDHAEKLLNRLNELNLICYLTTPESWKDYAQSKFVVSNPLNITECLTNNLASEDEAIAHYKRVIDLAESLEDVTTVELLRDILADEEQHKSELQDFINDINSANV